ncbi:MAG: PTS sugar transporter subunit IIB [Erysipelotrichaceae bacterium]|nr:PTS sugar transporter subunit IIB [Erysipelotrichaceae bacterium]
MKVPKVQCVCGFGCGSSLMLRMAIDDILSKLNLEADTFCGDVGTCLSNPCDVIFISRELAELIVDRAEVPVIIIENFMDSNEVEEKVKGYFDSLAE